VNIHLIAEPHLNWQGILQWLEDLGALPWALKFCDTQPYTADGLAELAGRRCYLSFGTREDGLNPNVVKIREDQEAYIANILSSKHGSVLDHELVRHRAGTAISQKSGRYVRLTKDIPFELPDIFKGYPALKRKSERLLAAMGEFQEDVALTLRLDQDGTPFARKKEVTSAMRRYAPEGRSTGLVWSANVRALRHVIETRSAAGAEVEIRDFAQQLGDIMVKKAPLLFGDFKVDEEGQWVPLNSKV
jgi:thymidylate synthase (FAD)